MANNYIPNGELALLIGDGGLSKPSPQPTKVSGDKVNACLEIQSTTRADIFMNPKTDAQIAAIQNPTNGMMAFSSDSGRFVGYYGGAWNQIGPIGSINYSSGTLSVADIQNMYTTPVQLLPAPGANLIYAIHSFMIEHVYQTNFAGGGAIYLQYDNLFALQPATFTMEKIVLTSGGNKISYQSGALDAVTSANAVNQPVCISNLTAAFTGGSTNTVKWTVWYSIIPAVS